MKGIKQGIVAATAAFALGAAPAFAEPTKMTDAQMDNVTGGLLTVIAVDVVDINQNDVRVAVPVAVNASAAVAVLGGAVAIAEQRPGRVTQ